MDTKLNRSQIAQLNAQIKLHLEDDEFAGEGHSKLALIDCVFKGVGMPLHWYLLALCGILLYVVC